MQPVHGQNYLNIDSYGKFISVGLEGSYYAFADVEFKQTWHAAFKTSFYTESLSQQLFIASFNKEFLFDHFSILPGIITGGKYSDGFHFAGLSSETSYNLNNLFSMGINPLLLYYAGSIHFRYQIGGMISLNKSPVYCFVRYGPPVYLMNSENNITVGLFFRDERLKVSAGLQVPDSYDLKYTRLVTSFIYSFKRGRDKEIKE